MKAPFLIFGATGYTGRALSLKLTQQGFPVFLSSKNDQELQTLLNQLQQPGKQADVLQADQLKQVIDEAGQKNGLQGLAFCVGNIVLKPFKQTKPEDFLNCYNLNVLSAINALKYSENYLKQNQNSSVVLFSTIASQRGFPNHTVISSAKGAVESLGKSLAAEWAPQIRVNVIAPSLTESKIAKPFLSNPQIKEKIAKGHPMQRTGVPEDVANLASFLLNPENSWITGQVISVDGGKNNLII